MRGGPGRGQGRKEAPAETKKIPMALRLAPDVAAAIRAQNEPQAVTVEKAVRAWLKMPEPDA